MSAWIDLLRKEVEHKTPKQVAKELGVSRSTVDLVCQEKYKAGTKKIEKKVIAIYGNNGNIHCPVLGVINPAKCADYWNKAKKIGMKAGNPETLRLYKTCENCVIRR